MFKTEYIKKSERGLLFDRGDLVAVLEPGAQRRPWRIWNPTRFQVRRVPVAEGHFQPFEFELDLIAKDEALLTHFELIEVRDYERAIVEREGRTEWIFGPGRHLLWKVAGSYVIKVVDVTREPKLSESLAQQVLARAEFSSQVWAFAVPPSQIAMLTREGQDRELLATGRHVYWARGEYPSCSFIDLRLTELTISGQDLLTADRVTLRLNVDVAFRVTDPWKATTEVEDFRASLYRDAQIALRRQVGVRSLDRLLGDKDALGLELENEVRTSAAAYGVEVQSIGVRDIILPGEMRELMNQVIAAEKAAEANVIKRREETAAARSQANTAKLLASNPGLARLRELEALQEIFVASRPTLVLGDGDALQRLRGLIDSQEV